MSNSSPDTSYALVSMQLNGYLVQNNVTARATAYDACEICCGKTDGITRSGVKAKPNHTIAVDPNVIPLGSKVYVPELDKIFTAEDTGGKIKGERIDIFMPTHEMAQKFGVKTVTVYVLQTPFQS